MHIKHWTIYILSFITGLGKQSEYIVALDQLDQFGDIFLHFATLTTPQIHEGRCLHVSSFRGYFCCSNHYIQYHFHICICTWMALFLYEHSFHGSSTRIYQWTPFHNVHTLHARSNCQCGFFECAGIGFSPLCNRLDKLMDCAKNFWW